VLRQAHEDKEQGWRQKEGYEKITRRLKARKSQVT
jgi:hypothetical protein